MNEQRAVNLNLKQVDIGVQGGKAAGDEESYPLSAFGDKLRHEGKVEALMCHRSKRSMGHEEGIASAAMARILHIMAMLTMSR